MAGLASPAAPCRRRSGRGPSSRTRSSRSRPPARRPFEARGRAPGGIDGGGGVLSPGPFSFGAADMAGEALRLHAQRRIERFVRRRRPQEARLLCVLRAEDLDLAHVAKRKPAAKR